METSKQKTVHSDFKREYLNAVKDAERVTRYIIKTQDLHVISKEDQEKLTSEIRWALMQLLESKQLIPSISSMLKNEEEWPIGLFESPMV